MTRRSPGCALPSCCRPINREEEARANLRRQLHLLVRVIGSDSFILAKNSAQWNDAHTSCDIAEFDRCAQDREYQRAVILWNGEPATGIHDDALGEIRERFARRYTDALQALAEQAKDSGDTARELQSLERLSAHDPVDEGILRKIMRLRAGCGDCAGAVTEYNTFAARLRADLDVEPEHETTQLFQQILFETRGGVPPHNLKPAPTSFVGRENELGTLGDLLDAHRVVSITGLAGVGKTRLALRGAMNRLDRYADGTWFVDLTSAADAGEVRQKVAQALNLSGDIPDQLRPLRMLLIIDNCEHVWEHVRDLTNDLAECAVRILATSRCRLEAKDEAVLQLQPLTAPAHQAVHPAREVAAYPAVRLFAERAAAVLPSFRLAEDNAHSVVEIVRSLDGLPLAIELVAARVGLLTPAGILKRLNGLSSLSLRHRAARHATLAAALQWSYEILSPLEQRVFARLSVFAGSFSVKAAQQLCADLVEDALAPLSELMEGSLVQTRHAGDSLRFALLDTVRRFAAERFDEHGELLTAQQRHARYYADLSARSAFSFGACDEIEVYRYAGL